jgi:hypothetical protein
MTEEEYLMRKTLTVLSVFLSLFVFTGFAASAEQEVYINHVIYTDLIGGKAQYDSAYFRSIGFYVDEIRGQTEQDKSTLGSFTIYNGSYHYYDNAGNRIDIQGQDTTFDLAYLDGDETYVEFMPYDGYQFISFRGDADGGLQNKTFEWTLFGANHVYTVPNFRTFNQQMSTYVPYVERDSAGGFSFKMIHPGDTGASVSVPDAAQYRLRLFDTEGVQIGRSDWAWFADGGKPAGNVAVTGNYGAADVYEVIVDIRLDKENTDPALISTYRWCFWQAKEGNGGLLDPSALSAPITITAGEERTFNIEFKTGYYSYNNPNPVHIADKSVVGLTSWFYDSNTRIGTLKIKGLRGGQTTFSILYEGDDSSLNNTAPTTVTVAGGSGGGGGGCNAGNMLFVLPIAGVLGVVLRKHT